MALKRINKVRDDEWRVRKTYTAPARERGFPCYEDRARAQLRSPFQLLFSPFLSAGRGSEGVSGEVADCKTQGNARVRAWAPTYVCPQKNSFAACVSTCLPTGVTRTVLH